MFAPIQDLEFKENPDSPARAYLEVIFHRIEFTKEAEEDYRAYQESAHKLREEKEAVFQKLVELYKAGDLEACYAIGCAYGSYDAGVKGNKKLAHRFFLQAAEAGHPAAMTSYAYICRRLSENKDTPEVIAWLKRGADADDTSAMRSLAYRYREGDTLEASPEKAEFWLKTAYDKGDKGCAYHLGKLYEFQFKDYDKAYEWYLIYAKHHPKDFRQLASFLNRDDTKYYGPAESLRLKIENLEHCYKYRKPIVCGEIAAHYLNGRGVGASKEEALRWLRKKLELLKPDTKLSRETRTEIEALEGNLL